MSEAPEWKNMADWSDLPDVYVTKVECQQGMFWRVEACSVPMVMAPEVRLIRADVSAARIADLTRQLAEEQRQHHETCARLAGAVERELNLTRQLAEARGDAEMAVALAYQRACEPVEANFPGTLYASNRTKTIAAILALAPAEALAEVQALKERADENKWREWSNQNAIAAAAWCAEAEREADRAEAAEAEVARLREALINIDAIDPESLLSGVSADAARGLVSRMGGIARTALTTPEKDTP